MRRSAKANLGDPAGNADDGLCVLRVRSGMIEKRLLLDR